MTEPNYSKKALIEFADMLENRGLARMNTARGLKVAASKILDGLSTHEDNDVRKVDVALAVRRYHNKNPGKLAPASLAEYQRRVQTLIREFVKYHEDPTGYVGIARGEPAGVRTNAKKGAPKRRRKQSEAARPATEVLEQSTPRPGLTFEFPLRQEFLAQVVLPRDLKVDEARRLGAFIMTLAADYEPGKS